MHTVYNSGKTLIILEVFHKHRQRVFYKKEKETAQEHHRVPENNCVVKPALQNYCVEVLFKVSRFIATEERLKKENY